MIVHIERIWSGHLNLLKCIRENLERTKLRPLESPGLDVSKFSMCTKIYTVCEPLHLKVDREPLAEENLSFTFEAVRFYNIPKTL